jgi:hypothetical protein
MTEPIFRGMRVPLVATHDAAAKAARDAVHRSLVAAAAADLTEAVTVGVDGTGRMVLLANGLARGRVHWLLALANSEIERASLTENGRIRESEG